MNPEDIRRELPKIAKKRTQHEQAAETEATKTREMVIAGLRQDMAPSELVRLSGWSAAYVRRIARAEGIEAPARYKEHADRLKQRP